MNQESYQRLIDALREEGDTPFYPHSSRGATIRSLVYGVIHEAGRPLHLKEIQAALAASGHVVANGQPYRALASTLRSYPTIFVPLGGGRWGLSQVR